MKAIFILVLVVVLGLFIGGWMFFVCQDEWCYFFEFQKVRWINSFEECVSRGLPVMESYPRQCRAGQKTFVESIAPKPFVSDKVKVFTPLPNSVVLSPFSVKGEARGFWFFEASFPVRLYDGNGKEIAVAIAQAQGEWMTTEFVSFSATLTFPLPDTTEGRLVFEKDNPSGLPEHDDQVSFPVRFQ